QEECGAMAGDTGTESVDALRVNLEVGQRLGEAPYHYLVRSKQLTAQSGLADPLGAGGSSVVYRALFKDKMARAIKLLAPREDLRRGIEYRSFVDNFNNEKDLLSDITHTRVSKIHDYGEFEIDGETYLFYAMDLIDGAELKTAARDDMRAQDLLVVLDQILDGLDYLHTRSPPVMHCDVKDGNILVRRTRDGWEGTLVDLGVAKPIKDGESPSLPPRDPEILAALGDQTTFNTSRKLMRREWRDWLMRPIPYPQLQAMFPSHDLYSVGVLLDEMLADEHPMRRRIELELGPDILAGIVAVRDRLKRPVGHEHYRSVAQLRDDWRKLMPGYLAPLDVPELAVGGSGMTSVALPGGRVTLTPRVKDTITHPLVQRLRNIPQLEFVSLIHPGATHTRLLHALATFDMAKQMVVSLLGDPMFRLMADGTEVEAALLWALLHDIGHYPLSHMFEDLVVEEERLGGHSRVPTDDDLFFAFVDPDSVEPRFAPFAEAIQSRFETTSTSVRENLREHLRRAGFADATIQALHGIHARDTPSRAVLCALLSSPIDVDKLAYLADDSRATGVGYGLGRDLDALLSSLRAPSERDFRPGDALLGITDKGLPAAEQVVLARYWMLRRVYWHRTNRSITAMVKFVAWELLEQNLLAMPDYVGRHLFETAETALQHMHDRFDALAEEHDDELRNPLPGLLGGSRDLYKEIVEIASGPEGDDEFHRRLFEKRPAEIRELIADCEACLRDAGVTDVRRGDVILDVPLKRRDALGAPIKVYADYGSSEGTNLELASPLLSQLRGEFVQHVKKSRLFVHPRIADDIAEWDAVALRLRNAMRARCGLPALTRRAATGS
ncbi:MAG TPA: hypothetical protein VK506_12490, partial [Conexibacter sp.]|nr:hypothetical protein [Conexibacter sp.]